MNSFLFAVMALVATVVALLMHMPSVRVHLRRLVAHPLFRPAVAIGAFALARLFNHDVLAVPFIVGVTTLSEGQYAGEFLLSEAEGTRSRDNVTVTVPAGEKYSPGLVLGQITSTGKYVGRDEDAVTGQEVAAGILYGECNNEDGDAPLDFAAVVVNADAEVRGEAVDANGGDEDDVLTELLALGIKVRGDLTNVAT